MSGVTPDIWQALTKAGVLPAGEGLSLPAATEGLAEDLLPAVIQAWERAEGTRRSTDAKRAARPRPTVQSLARTGGAANAGRARQHFASGQPLAWFAAGLVARWHTAGSTNCPGEFPTGTCSGQSDNVVHGAARRLCEDRSSAGFVALCDVDDHRAVCETCGIAVWAAYAADRCAQRRYSATEKMV